MIISTLIGGVTAIATAAAGALEILVKVGLAIEGLKAVGNLLGSVAKALGLVEENTTVEDLGDKALQSGYNPEDFNSYAEYVKAVEKFEVDPEKSKQWSEVQKTNKGLELFAGLSIEKGIPVEQLINAVGKHSDFFTDGVLNAIGDLARGSVSVISDIVKYIDGTEKSDAKLDQTEDVLANLYKKENPMVADTEALSKVMDLRVY